MNKQVNYIVCALSICLVFPIGILLARKVLVVEVVKQNQRMIDYEEEAKPKNLADTSLKLGKKIFEHQCKKLSHYI